MQDRKAGGITFANRATISRRAWIEKALAGVRGLAPGDQQVAAPAKSTKSPLYLVVSNRSG